jgi:hypothetical protein
MADKQYLISGHENYTLAGMDVYKNDSIIPVKRVLNNGVIGWYLNRKFISRNKIKGLIKK